MHSTPREDFTDDELDSISHSYRDFISMKSGFLECEHNLPINYVIVQLTHMPSEIRQSSGTREFKLGVTQGHFLLERFIF